MYCPSCSTKSAEGAKFCKSCGMNLTIITQAINGSVAVTEPGRDREFKRLRRQISEGIKGAAIGAAILFAAALAYMLITNAPFAYAITLLLALVGLIKLFINIGSILDAKVGTKLVDQTLQTRASGGLNGASLPSPPAGSRVSGEYRSPAGSRASGEYRRPLSATGRASETGTLAANPSAPANGAEKAPAMTGRVNREQSMPLRRLDADEDLMAKLRN
jgi:hypothetical protein